MKWRRLHSCFGPAASAGAAPTPHAAARAAARARGETPRPSTAPTRARHDADLAGRVDVAGHDADLALACSGRWRGGAGGRGRGGGGVACVGAARQRRRRRWQRQRAAVGRRQCAPGLMMPGQLGPMSRVLLCSLMIFLTRTCGEREGRCAVRRAGENDVTRRERPLSGANAPVRCGLPLQCTPAGPRGHQWQQRPAPRPQPRRPPCRAAGCPR